MEREETMEPQIDGEIKKNLGLGLGLQTLSLEPHI